MDNELKELAEQLAEVLKKQSKKIGHEKESGVQWLMITVSHCAEHNNKEMLLEYQIYGKEDKKAQRWSDKEWEVT